MPTDDPRAAIVSDPDGCEVVLLARIWEEKIARDHPERVDHRDAVMETVAKPDHVEPDAIAARTRFYRRGVGPSRWLMVVVSYEQSRRGSSPRWPTGRIQSDGSHEHPHRAAGL